MKLSCHQPEGLVQLGSLEIAPVVMLYVEPSPALEIFVQEASVRLFKALHHEDHVPAPEMEIPDPRGPVAPILPVGIVSCNVFQDMVLPLSVGPDLQEGEAIIILTRCGS